MLACGLGATGPAAVAAPDEPSGWVELSAGPGSGMHNLGPGDVAHWPVDVSVRGEAATSLEVSLHTEPASSGLLHEFLSVELRACSRPWVHNRCEAGQRVLLERTAFKEAGGLRVDLTEPGASPPAGGYVLLTASLASDVPQEIQGSATHIVVGFHGSGDDPGNGLTDDKATGTFPGSSPPQSAALAETGARLGGFTLLGLLAVVTGFGLARLRAARA